MLLQILLKEKAHIKLETKGFWNFVMYYYCVL